MSFMAMANTLSIFKSKAPALLLMRTYSKPTVRK